MYTVARFCVAKCFQHQENHLKIQIRLISNGVPTHPHYRANLLIRKPYIEGKKEGCGIYVGDSFIVRKVSEGEFSFNPTLGVKQCRTESKWIK